jgi:hypothetical protein
MKYYNVFQLCFNIYLSVSIHYKKLNYETKNILYH